jgi:hypothetical protein
MRGAEPVNDEIEVGFNQDFEIAWYRTEVIGRFVMIGFTCVALSGLLGRGPYSHDRAQAPGGGLSVDFEPVARSQTATLVTFHVENPEAIPRTLELSVGQGFVQPMGYQRAVPFADSSSVSDDGMDLRFTIQPRQSDALVRLQLQPEAVGLVRLHASAGSARVDWTMFVVP